MYCSDTWNRRIPKNKLKAYKALIDDGTIEVRQVTYFRNAGRILVEYDAESHEDVISKLKRLSVPD